ncbi:related to fructosyl amino acid oxidase [Cephalotrichum gorgonifer]|uniref:Related to fructosyl amino acid oxidase n=1 Tax=Cephalotrichum gorgonifer TaxID=2041049 RepID=A0AAE8N3W8_9PEZI|nr:related to fructosyl amino acid oxidase [Cephalotrichum gorgonifer]
MPRPNLPYVPPSSVLIIGSGVFGLSTAHALATRPSFSSTKITLVDRITHIKDGDMPSTDAASMDSSRIIRADYADPTYTRLADEAQAFWRQQGDGELGGGGRYSESGMLVVGVEGTGGMKYVKESYRNVKELAEEGGYGEKIVEYGSSEAVTGFLGTGAKGSGDWGYLNKVSGWANAEKGMAWLLDQVKRTARVEFVGGTVDSLVWDGEKGEVTGARLADGTTLGAELVIVAAGAWTGALVDLRGLCTATGQVLGYIDITEEEQEKLKDMPVVLNLSSGLFIIPPRDRVLKAARHAYGYLNPVDIPSSKVLQKKVSLDSKEGGELGTMRISLPRTSADSEPRLPLEAEVDLRRAIEQFIPISGLNDRPFSSRRICWYADTPTGDYIADYHPAWKGVFVATGGSGHGYKFLPVLGKKIVDCITGEGSETVREKWRWRDEGEVTIVDGVESVVTKDGSRAGYPGMVLDRELEGKGISYPNGNVN